ncbi:hydrolase 1, exosortase A system-associated [Pelomonas sp. CA6]|uniref:hydrolase 1, exosortase A system-associated n=1 Tax=Pelomonas sp. CA6 TaxID=2907999 RepID=UPI001F4BD900|nr:hydrolase 1, exosortase A system-associated [Pelomonas sp. CA6]MCH7344179.1 hydrolase 1, exosortase A system-associated [Pelomonas sp. CA6]
MTAPAWTERVLPLVCQGEALTAIACEPAAAARRDLGVLIVVGGPQYRAGSHRQFVQLARALAAAGHPCLRFDVRGMGDSEGEPRGFEAQGEDIAAALQTWRDHGGPQDIVLWGLCDGASAALLFLLQHPEHAVAGLCLLNPWVRTEHSQVSTQVRHYYLQRLREKAFWLKLLRGGVGLGALREAAAKLMQVLGQRRRAAASTAAGAGPQLAALPYQERMAHAAAGFAGPVLLVLSGRDYTAREFDDSARAHPLWQRALARDGVQRLALDEADHTFSRRADSLALERACVDWLDHAFARRSATR